MKRITAWMSLLVLIPLAACSVVGIGGGPKGIAPTATISPEQLQTQVNQMLTLMPTSPAQPQASATAALPTVPVEGAGQPAIMTATATATLALPTDTPVPATATQAPAEATATVAAPAPTATSPSGPTFTPAPGDPRSRLGAPSSTDSMDDADTWTWPTGKDKYTSASFGDGRQSVTALTGTDGWRLANPTGVEFGNLYLEGTFRTTTCASTDHYGLIFRVPVLDEADQGYLFGVTCDGRYSLRRWNGKVGVKGEMKWLVNWTANSAIDTGSNKTNRLGAMMVGSRLLLYANGKLLTEVQDATFSSGYFGVFVGSDVTDQLTVQVDEMSYWKNPAP